jgi:hypothetical protein
MDFDSDDSMYDPDFVPSDGAGTDSSESDSANESWNPPLSSRRASTFSESELPPLPEVQRRISARRIGNTVLDANNEPGTSSTTTNIPSTSATLTTDQNNPSLYGTTSAEINESEWLKEKLDSMEWHMPTLEGPTQIQYTGPISGLKDIFSGILAYALPIDYFDLFMTNDIIQHIVDQTNLYATQQLLSNDVSSGSPVTVAEMTKFLALIGWMGLVKLPSIKDYWRVHKLYNIPLARTVMPRNRFELILKFIHFSDNTLANPDDRLYKLRDVLDKFINNYKHTYTPCEKICVDESLIPWRGRLLFRQYIPNKSAKYGIKVFKLCTEKGYTWNLAVYCGKSRDPQTEVSEKIVMSLAEDLLGEGRTMYTDNYYTSVPLALRLRKRKTNLVGTLRANRKYLPKEVTQAKLKRGEMAAKESDNGITVLNWRDKRDVRMLTTKTSALEMVPHNSRTRNAVHMKPKCIADYNKGKSSIDISDQMATYGSALRRCTKWYRKLAFEIIWGTSIVNAHFLYNEYSNQKKLTITEFREQVINALLERVSSTNIDRPSRSRTEDKHHLVQNIVGGKKVRGRCVECYKIYGRKGIQIESGKNKRAPQIYTKCSVCNIFLCRQCFNKTH